MKWRYFILFLGVMLFVIPTDVSAAPANSDFKDDAFYSCVIDALNESNIDGKNDRGYDYVATDSELSQLDSLSCLEKNVTDVTGLEKMINLQGLYLSDNDISKIDLSHNVNLEEVSLDRNQIREIDLSHNVRLVTLDVWSNQLSEIDLNHNVNLEEVSLDLNQIREIDLSHNVGLVTLSVWHNQLSKIDLSHNRNLRKLTLSDNQISKIDLSNNTSLEYLSLGDNRITFIDISMLRNLRNFYASGNQITEMKLDLNQSIKIFSISNNLIKDLQIPYSVESVEVFGNPVEVYDFTKLENLKRIAYAYETENVPTVLLPVNRTYELWRHVDSTILNTLFHSSESDVVSIVDQDGDYYLKTLSNGSSLVTTNHPYVEPSTFQMNIKVEGTKDDTVHDGDIDQSSPDSVIEETIENPETGIRTKDIFVSSIVMLIIGGVAYMKLKKLSKFKSM